MRFSRRLKARHRGATLVELAITLPVMLMVVFGLIEYAIMLGALIVMNNTANESARQTTVYRSGYTLAQYQSFALNALNNNLPTYVGAFRQNVQRTVTSQTCGDSTCLTLTLTYPNYKTNPLVMNYKLLPLPASLTVQSVTRVEPNNG